MKHRERAYRLGIVLCLCTGMVACQKTSEPPSSKVKNEANPAKKVEVVQKRAAPPQVVKKEEGLPAKKQPSWMTRFSPAELETIQKEGRMTELEHHDLASFYVQSYSDEDVEAYIPLAYEKLRASKEFKPTPEQTQIFEALLKAPRNRGTMYAFMVAMTKKQIEAVGY